MVCDLYHTSMIDMISYLKQTLLITVPSNINNLMCRALNPTQVNISWEPPTQPNGVIHFYEVILNNINTAQNTTKYVDSDMTTQSTTMSHLHPNHHYLCSVAAHSAVGRSASSIQSIKLAQSSMCVIDIFVVFYYFCTILRSNRCP